MLKVILPLGGPSDLFVKAGFLYPKPLIEICGKPMIQWVVENLKSLKKSYQLIFIIKEEDSNTYHLDNTLRLLDENCQIIKLKRNTKGGLCSVLMAIDIIEENDSILILNSDQIIDVDLSNVQDYWLQKKTDVGIVTFQSVHPRWSYALVDNEEVIQTAEKNPISKHAIAGYYFFNKAKFFFDCAFKTIFNDVQKDGFFYISPVINEFILRNKKIHYYEISNDQYHSFYTPKLIAEFKPRKDANREL
jgi:NDP-sugar pyrophosphorylase family protein